MEINTYKFVNIFRYSQYLFIRMYSWFYMCIYKGVGISMLFDLLSGFPQILRGGVLNQWQVVTTGRWSPGVGVEDHRDMVALAIFIAGGSQPYDSNADNHGRFSLVILDC